MSESPELRRYYLYNFLTGLTQFKGGYFTMTYFFFQGFPVEYLVTAIFAFSVMSLIALKPVMWIMERFGPQTTFRLHPLAKTTSILCAFYLLNGPNLFFVILWQATHAWNNILQRAPLTAYFSEYGSNKNRGKQVGITNVLQSVANIILPILAGALIDHTGIVILLLMDLVIKTLCAFILRFPSKTGLVSTNTRIVPLLRSFPKPLAKGLFTSALPYAFTEDLFSVFAALILRSYTALGVFIGLRLIAGILANLWVGKMNDTGRGQGILLGGVIIHSMIWLFVPQISTGAVMFAVQFLLGVTGILLEIPVESVYHNTAKTAGKVAEYSLSREFYYEGGMALGCGILLIILHFTSAWQALFPVAVIAPLGLLFVLPLFTKKQTNT